MFVQTPIDEQAWRRLLAQSEQASWFQRPEAYRFLSHLHCLQAFAYGYEERGELVALACGWIQAEGRGVKAWLTRRAIIQGGVLLSPTVSETVLAEFLQQLRRALAPQTIYVEIRNNSDYSPYREIFQQAGFVYQPHLNFLLPVTDESKCLAALSESKRRQWRKAQQAGVTCTPARNEEEVRLLYYLLRYTYARYVGTPLFPPEFFTQLYRQPNTLFRLVRYQGRVIGGMVQVIHPGKAVYDWFVCGMDREYKEAYPSVVATWGAVQTALERQIPVYDMMGAGEPDKPYGVRDFKAGFGGKLVEQGRFLYISSPLRYALGCFGVRLIRKK